MSILERIGYGSSFNTLTRHGNMLEKASMNARGHVKLGREIDFYKYVCEHNVPIKLPTLVSSSKEENKYCMRYMEGYVPLYTVFPRYTLNEKAQILHTIRTSLSAMHAHTRISVDETILIQALRYEFHDKLLERYAEVESVLQQFSHISHVNGLPIQHITALVPALYNKVVAHFMKQSPEYCLIHGDCQFNNILIHLDTQDIVFIDPRACFGDSMFGIKEYDYAKVKFALSGYDRFDNESVDHLNIQGDNLILDNMCIYEEVSEPIEEIIVALIWLGNAHCFSSQPAKAAYSYFYAAFLATHCLDK